MPGDKQPFASGVSANPGGRPKRTPEMRQAIALGGERGLRKVTELIDHQDPRVALDASKYMVDQWIGKPVQAISGPEGEPLLPAFDVGGMNDADLGALVRLARIAAASATGGVGGVGSEGDGGDSPSGGSESP